MRRREFLGALGGVAAAWPLAAQAQQLSPNAGGRTARVAMLTSATGGKELVDIVRDQLATLGWTEGRNLRLDYRMAEGDVSKLTGYVRELILLRPDVMIGGNTTVVAAWLRETSTIPIVFTGVSDPIGSGFISSFARPGGNATGFMSNDPSLTGKWLQLLKELAPQTSRAIAFVNPATSPFKGEHYLAAFNEAARTIGLEPITAPIDTRDDIEPAFEKAGSAPQTGIILIPSAFILSHRADIASAAIRNRLPVVAAYREHPVAGGLVSYGTPNSPGYRAAAGYVDRILRGEKPSDLPVQTPTIFLLTINLHAAKAIGLEISPTLLARADEVIE